MKKGKSILSLILVIAVTALFGMTCVLGLDLKGMGAAKNINLGLDLEGGVSITYQVKGDKPSQADMDDTVYKLQKRVEQYSTEAQAYQVGDNRISIEIPGVSDANKILEELGQPGSLYFIKHKDSEGNENYSLTASGYTLNKSIDELKDTDSIVLTGTEVKTASAGAINDSTTGNKKYGVDLELTDEGTEKFKTATEEAYNNNHDTIAIYYDGALISVPSVKAVIENGKAQISGNMDYEEADNIASTIRIGGLNLELEELSSEVVGAQLGQDALKGSLIAGAIGLAIVCVFMCWVYLLPGLASSLALILYTELILILLNAFDITLTLPGIAGIILGIGMAVDANVIIYARIQEEIAAGNSVKASIKEGFSKAFSAIFDGNITTLIASLVLMWLGSGTVKGFAYTLALGIVVSMFTALVVSRFVMKALYAVGFHDEKFYGRAKERKVFDIVGKRKGFFILSIILILSGPVAMIAHHQIDGTALNYALDFSGGTATTVTFNEDMDIKQIDSEVTPLVEEITGDKNVQPTKVVGTNQVVIKTRTLSQAEREKLDDALVEKFEVDKSLIATESISSTVSSEMRRDALVAVIVATLFMLAYIWFRFKDIRFAGSAVIALLHDVLVVFAFYAISRISVGNTFIACMLTIVGYSINATIVIFDRIRENMKATRENLPEVVNKSITQTLTRSIYTSFTTFVMVAALYVLGVSSIREFAAPLMMGVICGAYSSVCITGALWLVMKRYYRKTPVAAVAAKNTSASAKQANTAKKNTQSGKKNPDQPKKKNRKRVAERLAAQEAAAKENTSANENKGE